MALKQKQQQQRRSIAFLRALLQSAFLLSLLLLDYVTTTTTTHAQQEQRQQQQRQNNNFTPECPPNFSGYRSGPDCKSYYVCDHGTVAASLSYCSAGTIFNEFLGVCDFESNFECGSTRPPSRRPTKRPTVSPTARLMPTTPHPTLPPNTRSPSANVGVEDALQYAKGDIDGKLFVYQSGWSQWIPSTQYRFDGFMRGLQIMYLEGVGDLTFYLGEDVADRTEGTVVGLVNIAAFLAQSMKETIKYDACDENNWDVIDGTYPLSNACGQLEQSYQDYNCPEGSEHMQCEVDLDMEQKATTQAGWYGAPGPLFCGPKSKYPFVGYWDYSHTCDFPWKDPPELCMDYPGQRGGQAVNDEPVENRNGRTDVEGCCWWGRGVIQTTGVCNFGMLNYYLGKRAADEGRDSRYPHIDFCKDPGAVCSREEHPELKWIAGMFYWIRSLQTYDEGWSYIDNLKSFVQGGMKDDSFINAVSGIVNRGCHNPPCGTGPLDGAYERKENFVKVLEILLEEDGSPRVYRPGPMPTYMPSDSPGKFEAATKYVNQAMPRPPPTLPSSGYNNKEMLVNDQILTEERFESGDQDEEEDWSESSPSSTTMNLWCGESQYDAFQNCGRNGFDCRDGNCHNDLKCFMVNDACDKEEEEEDITTTQQLPPPTSAKPTRQPTPRPIAAKSETDQIASVNNTGLRQQYCAESKAALATACVTAPTCAQSEDCPSGTYCWAEHLCGTEHPTPAAVILSSKPTTYMPTYDTYMPTNPPQSGAPTSIQFDITATFFCGTDRAHASTSCHKRCRSGSREDCDEGETCFGYTSCEAEIPRLPALGAKGPQSKQPTVPSPIPDTNNEPNLPAEIEPQTQKPTPPPAPNSNNGSADVSKSTSALQQLFCGTDMAELEASCESAQSCNSGPCPSGMFCFPFTCTKVAVEGEESPPASTPDDSIIIDGKPTPVENQGQAPAESNLPLSQVENQSPAPTTEYNERYRDLCPQSSFVGWHTTAPCKEYYTCDNGAPGVIQVCGESLKFDKVRNECHSEQSVNSYCYGPPLESNNDQTDGQQQGGGNGNNSASRGLCKEGFTGWEARLGCREYFWCDHGIANFIYDCGDDLLFDRTIELCNFKHLVHCVDKGGPATPPPVPPPTSQPTPPPVARQTFPPTMSESPSSTEDRMVNNYGYDYNWSDTASPTLPQGQSERPPWLMNVIMTNNNGSGDALGAARYGWLLLLFPVQIVMLW
mmetsp:Transcript_1949/g.4577  ORF Transcript_1949/g.4577 Transcript_1949/m.4577 type:complete len:1223 (-) Transcript_1949:74-3742(-)